MRLQLTRPRPRSIAALFLSVGIASAASVALVTDASAHANVVSGVAACQVDGTYTITWTIANDFNLKEVASLVSHTGGGVVTGLPAPIAASPPNTTFKSVTAVETGVPGTKTTASLTAHGLWSDAHVTDNVGNVQLGGDCHSTIPPTTATAPKFTNASCTVSTGSYMIPVATGVDYFVSIGGGAATAAPAGTVSEPIGTVIVVTAKAKAGVTLTGTTSWSHTIAGAGTCVVTVTPVAPTITQGVCTGGTETAAFITIPATTGVLYMQGTTTLAAGPLAVAFGSSTTITASAAPGFTLAAPVSWTLMANAAVTCTTSGGGSTPPPVTSTPPPATATPPTSVLGITFVNTPPVAAAPAAAPQAAVLPFTGMPVRQAALLGLGLILAGALLVGSARRERLTR
jgi:hypothetical protein